MLSGEALDIAFALRVAVGAQTQGDGPTLQELRQASGMQDATAFGRALAELESIGFVAIDHGPPAARVIVLAPLQIYLDDLESQGTDDF